MIQLFLRGFNGSPRGMSSCLDTNRCMRENAERGTDYSSCCAIHSEQNSIFKSSTPSFFSNSSRLIPS